MNKKANCGLSLNTNASIDNDNLFTPYIIGKVYKSRIFKCVYVSVCALKQSGLVEKLEQNKKNFFLQLNAWVLSKFTMFYFIDEILCIYTHYNDEQCDFFSISC